jgi:hypothetical protein
VCVCVCVCNIHSHIYVVRLLVSMSCLVSRSDDTAAAVVLSEALGRGTKVELPATCWTLAPSRAATAR